MMKEATITGSELKRIYASSEKNRTKSKSITNGGVRDIIMHLKNGFEYHYFCDLTSELKVSKGEAAELLTIPVTTLNRRKSTHFNTEESDKILRFMSLYENTVELFNGNEQKALIWLKSPLKRFGNETPLEFAKTGYGAKEVDRIINCLKYGDYL